jgi:hypothetical protein
MAGKKRIIGEIMVSLGYVTLDQINQARWHQMQGVAKRIGECLVDLGHTSDHEVRRALEVQEMDSVG